MPHPSTLSRLVCGIRDHLRRARDCRLISVLTSGSGAIILVRMKATTKVITRAITKVLSWKPGQWRFRRRTWNLPRENESQTRRGKMSNTPQLVYSRRFERRYFTCIRERRFGWSEYSTRNVILTYNYIHSSGQLFWRVISAFFKAFPLQPHLHIRRKTILMRRYAIQRPDVTQFQRIMLFLCIHTTLTCL